MRYSLIVVWTVYLLIICTDYLTTKCSSYTYRITTKICSQKCFIFYILINLHWNRYRHKNSFPFSAFSHLSKSVRPVSSWIPVIEYLSHKNDFKNCNQLTFISILYEDFSSNSFNCTRTHRWPLGIVFLFHIITSL